MFPSSICLYIGSNASQGVWTLFARKCRWAVSAPEALNLFTIMQWNAANFPVAEMRGNDWTIAHAFYANAGGFIWESKDCPALPINATSILYLRSTGWIDTPVITRENIWDRSKADLVAKVLAMLQTGWLLLQCIARAVRSTGNCHLTTRTRYDFLLLPTIFLGQQATKCLRAYHNQAGLADCGHSHRGGERSVRGYAHGFRRETPPLARLGWKRRLSLLHYGDLHSRPLNRIPNSYCPQAKTHFVSGSCLFCTCRCASHWTVQDIRIPQVRRSGHLAWRASSTTFLPVMVLVVPFLSCRLNSTVV